MRISISSYLRARDLKTLDVEWISDSMVAAGASAPWWRVQLTQRSNKRRCCAHPRSHAQCEKLAHRERCDFGLAESAKRALHPFRSLSSDRRAVCGVAREARRPACIRALRTLLTPR